MSAALLPATGLFPCGNAQAGATATPWYWVDASAAWRSPEGAPLNLNFVSLLMAAASANAVVELRYVTDGAWRLLDSLPGHGRDGLVDTRVKHQALVTDLDGAKQGSLAGLLKIIRTPRKSAWAFRKTITPPTWLAPVCADSAMHVAGVAYTCRSSAELPADLIGFARARHPWIMRDPLGWLSAVRPIVLANPES